jgi:hypothetical protein
MALNRYCQAILQQELGKPDYDGMTASQAWVWLTVPVNPSTTTVDTGVLLTPDVVEKALGSVKAEALANAIRAAVPVRGDLFISEGLDPLDKTLPAFLRSLVTSGKVAHADMNTLLALGQETVIARPAQARFDERFQPANWPPHVDLSGNAVDASDLSYCQSCNTKNPLPAPTNCINPDCNRPLLAGADPQHRRIGPAMGLNGFINCLQLQQDDFNAAWATAGRC